MPTPDPTPSQVVASLGHCGGRPSAAWNEILRVLHDVLPGAVSLANSRFGLHLPPLQGFIVAGEAAPAGFPYGEVALSLDSQSFADGFMDGANVVVNIVTQKGTANRYDLMRLSDLACLARAALYPFYGPRADAAGRKIWDTLTPTALSLGPASETTLGAALHLRLEAFPVDELGWDAWTPGSVPALARRADPTPEEVLDALPLCGGRLSLAREATLDICQRQLPGVLAQLKASRGIDLKPVANFQILGETLAAPFPSLVVGATASTEALAPGVFMDRVAINAYCIAGTSENRYGKDERADFAGVVRALLGCYQEGCVDGQGRQAWSNLTPSSLSLGQMPWQQASGTTVSFEAIQGPGESRW